MVTDEGGGIAGYVAIFSDITFRRRAEQELLRQATTDSLTGLANRQLFNRLLSSTIEQATRYKRDAACCSWTWTASRILNDTARGTPSATALREIAARLRGAVRISDEVARLGGDEFVVILPEVRGRQAAAAVAEKLLEDIALPLSTARPGAAADGQHRRGHDPRRRRHPGSPAARGRSGHVRGQAGGQEHGAVFVRARFALMGAGGAPGPGPDRNQTGTPHAEAFRRPRIGS